MISDEVRRIARLLESVVKLSRVPVREVERRVEYGAGTLNRLFNGRIELKVRHILEILDAVDMNPESFFQIVFRREEDQGELAAQILGALRSQGYTPSQPDLSDAISDEELDRRIEAVVARMLADREAAERTPGGSGTGRAKLTRRRRPAG